MTYPGFQAIPTWPNPAQPAATPSFQPPAPPAGVPNPMGQLDPDNPFLDPSGGGGALAPKARDLVDCTVIIEPLSYNPAAKFKDQVRPSATFNLYVVTAPSWPLRFGDDQDKGTPHTHMIEGPAYFSGVMSANTGFAQEVSKNLGKGIVLGVIQRGTKGNRPYLVTSVDTDVNQQPRPDAAARRQAAVQLYQAHKSGQWVSPEPVELATSHVPQGAVSYGPPAGPPNPPAWPAPPTFQPPAGPAWGPQQPTPVSAAPAPSGDLPAPPGWPAEVWSSYSPDQKQQIYAQAAAAQAAGAPPVS